MSFCFKKNLFETFFYQDLQNRETELKLLRREKFINQGSEDSDSELQMNGKIRPSKSIGELYEALWQSTSKRLVKKSFQYNLHVLFRKFLYFSNVMTYRKNSISLAQLCNLNSDENDVISSHQLIEKWECLIQERKQQNIG